MNVLIKEENSDFSKQILTQINKESNSENIIELKKLCKKFGDFTAVNNISFCVKKGELFSLLGPNGAGKSTTIKMLTTILKPTQGDAIINGISLINKKDKIKPLIGVCPQENVLFEELTAEANVEFVAKMYSMKREEVKSRSLALLEKMKIAHKEIPCKKFSGGMKRRLNLIMSLVHSPQILFLDEPSAGLDPQARRLVWNYIKNLKNTGMTIVLTTHDMIEAESLSDHIAIIDQGNIIALGTPDELKEVIENGNKLELKFSDEKQRELAFKNLKSISEIKDISKVNGNKLELDFSGGINTLRYKILDCSDSITSLQFREDTLEDVFLHLTGRSLRE